ncbi:TetR/AcrR family transcriptional regulator [Nocardia miyunensis]|uniref:TetR/AcrR family transcriptional regulator n=1 Tax=Nocardia miyunensis TaxID=282684 RepID=UPI002481153E|nr:helix-turn-helix domain-containing protein [Nocardia miyunensis]
MVIREVEGDGYGWPVHVGRPTGADGEQTRRRIRTAAMNHMADVGYANATMKAIAEQAHLTSAGIYHHFRSEEALLSTPSNRCSMK